VYPHDTGSAVARQQYAPDAVKDRIYYEPTDHGAESRYKERALRIRAILRGDDEKSDATLRQSGTGEVRT
jgi:putative ATPase